MNATRHTMTRRAAPLLLLGWLLLGPATAMAQTPAAPKPPPVKLDPEVQALLDESNKLPEFHYPDDPDKRDPFTSSLQQVQEEKQKQAEANKPVREKEPLELFPLDSLKLVAILELADGPLAMVQDPKGKGYPVRVGNYMGTREGRIIRIGNRMVVLKEPNPTKDDPAATRNTELKLSEESE